MENSTKLPANLDLATKLRVLRSGVGEHLFVVDGSRLFDIPSELGTQITTWMEAENPSDSDKSDIANFLATLSPHPEFQFIDGTPLTPPPLFSLSLNVAQTCNMGCSYCYADEGKFGGRDRLMSLEVAQQAVDRLIAESEPGAEIVVGYMGGEPLINRQLVHKITHYATKAAAQANRRVRFSLTTNATLIKPEDAQLFAEFPFTVAVSIDGDRQTNDAVRKMRDGSGSYERLMAGLKILKEYGRPRHLSARVTVTPKTGALLPILDHLIELGFNEVGLAAVLVSPDPSLAFTSEDFRLFTERMIRCGEKAKAELLAGRPYPFGNFEVALNEIHRGSHRPYPCGAGAAYLSVNAEGKLYACHRLVDDPAYFMGDIETGSNLALRTEHLARNHVNLQEPCSSCWARYLCGGGCYHEVSRRGRLGCDYIRSWLDFCLRAYGELSTLKPEYFISPQNYWQNHTSNPSTVAT